MRICLLVATGLLGVCAAVPAARAARLPTDVVPVFQSVHLRVDADTTDYRGSVHMALNVKKATTRIQLFALGQTLEDVRLVRHGKRVAVKVERGDWGLLTLVLASPIAPGRSELDIRFTKSLDTQAVGLYRVRKDGLGYTFTQFEAEDARKAFPCWDQPAFKFPYQFTLEVPERHQAITNTPVESETVKDGWRTIVFAKTPPLPSYLLAIATGPLEFTPVPGTKVPTRIVCVKGQSQLTGLAVRETPRILAALETYFEQSYPFAKLDLVAVPGRLPESSMARLPAYCAGCSAERLAEGKAFFAEAAHHMSGMDKQLERTAESVQDCVSLRAREGQVVAAYLKRLTAAN